MEGSPSQRWLAVNHSALEGCLRSLDSNSKLQSRSLLPKISSLDRHACKEGVLTPMGTRKSVYNKFDHSKEWQKALFTGLPKSKIAALDIYK